MQRQFKLQSSNYLVFLLMVAHGITLAALFPLAFPAWAKMGLALLVLLSMGYHIRRDARLSMRSSCVELMREGELWVLTTRGGEHLTCRMLRDSLVTPYLAVLNVLPEGAHFVRSVVILPDSMDTESFRQLRVWMKWGDSAV